VSANPWRGEVSLVLGEVAHVLRPSFAALVAAEEELGPLFALIERASSGQLRLAELVALFWHCLEAKEHQAREAFAEAVARSGLAHCTEPLKALLTQVLKGGG
jgi:hypothetical protein